MLTYQDYLEAAASGKSEEFVRRVINEHRESELYRDARAADEYDAERNITIREFIKIYFDKLGRPIKDETASNMKLTSNFFARLNTQRCTYSLGNGLTFQAEGVQEKLGAKADKVIKDGGYYGLIHGVSFLYWAYDHIHLFKITEFAPLWDEENSSLGAGVRFWQLEERKPLRAVLYTQEGYQSFYSAEGSIGGLKADGEIKPYRMTVQITPGTGEETITEHNYSALPIVPLWGSRLHQSTLTGMRTKIDAYDMIQSGFANDLQDCAQIYWIVSGAGGMSDKDLDKFRERILYRHIANTHEEVSVTPYTQEVPYQARKELLAQLKSQMYEDFGGLDTSSISAAAKTATEINAAYQPMDENADDFEFQIIEAVQKLLALQGVSEKDATPQFKRNRISNQLEQVQMVMMEAQYLDDETILTKLPNISPEEIERIMAKKEADEIARAGDREEETEEPETEVTEDGEEA